MKRAILVCISLVACTTPDDELTSSTEQASLTDGRERLLADYAGRRGQSAAAMWPQLTAAQQGVFLTLTHRLSLSVLPDGSNALDQLDAVYSIRGQDGGSCGGGEYNRMFFSLTPALYDAFVNRSLDDVWGGRSWKPSGDIAGPHGPFDASNETEYGSPRGQVHFFSRAPVYPPGQILAFVSCPSGYSQDSLIDDAMEEEGTMRFFDPSTGNVEWCHYAKIHHPSTRPVCRDGLEGCIQDPELAEMDQDYTWNHDSATTCPYDGFASGLDMYEANHGRGTFERAWQPAGS